MGIADEIVAMVLSSVEVGVFNVATGKVIRFDELRGYGFIAPDNGSEDVFVHANDLLDGKSLFRPGQHVVFEVEDGERGLKASGVRIDPNIATAPVRHAVTTATRPVGGTAEAEDGMCDLLSGAEFQHELTEVLLAVVPTLTGAQILETRKRVTELAASHNWVEL
jgi:cold shock protein